MSLYTDPISNRRSEVHSEPSERRGSSKLVNQPVKANGSQVARRPTAPEADPVLYSEDLSVGDRWTTEMRCISESDVRDFASLTGDHTPLHDQGGAGSPFGKPIVHGLLGLSVLAGLGSKHPNASTLALVGIEGWKFLAPVFMGDSVRARNEILEINPHGRRAAKVRWLRQLIDESGRVLQEGHFVTLVASRKRAASRPR